MAQLLQLQQRQSLPFVETVAGHPQKVVMTVMEEIGMVVRRLAELRDIGNAPDR